MGDETSDALDPGIAAALDEVLVPAAGDAAFLARVRRLVENCLADNYDASDVRSVIELAMAPAEGGGDGA